MIVLFFVFTVVDGKMEVKFCLGKTVMKWKGENKGLQVATEQKIGSQIPAV